MPTYLRRKMLVRLRPNPTNDVAFEYTKDSLFRKVSTQIAKYEQGLRATNVGVGIRKLRSLERWIDNWPEANNADVPSEFLPWFQQNKMLSDRRFFVSIYCPLCDESCSVKDVKLVSWTAQKPKRHSRGGGRGKYFACQDDHLLYTITRRIS